MTPKIGRRVLLQEDAIPTFIEEVKKRECIWNHDDEKYNDRYEQMLAWKEIATLMDQPADILKSKWKNLRDIFKREIRSQRRKCRKNIEKLEDYQGPWKLFPSLWFIHRPEEAVNIDLEDDPNEETYEEDEEKNPLDNFVKCEPQEELNEDEEAEGWYVEVNPPDMVSRKRKRRGGPDFDMMFLQSLTPFLRQLEPMRKLIVRSKIQEIMINEIAAQKQQTMKNSKKVETVTLAAEY